MKLITITGSSGAGKDTVARILSEMTGYEVLCSYTTRPMREGEEEGREHHFVKSCDVPKEKMLAYTVYGGYEYWATIDQIKGTVIYVIDEDGLRELYSRFPKIPTIHVYLNATLEDRKVRGIALERIERDECRKLLPDSFYQYILHNVGTKEELRKMVGCFVEWME